MLAMPDSHLFMWKTLCTQSMKFFSIICWVDQGFSVLQCCQKNGVLANRGRFKEGTESLSLQELICGECLVPEALRDLSPPALLCTEALQIQASSGG